jgi:hypothetical protein
MRFASLASVLGLAAWSLAAGAVAAPAAARFPTRAGGAKIELDPAQLSFLYQQNDDPWDSAPCTHVKANEFLDWDVTCQFQGTKHTYQVHLGVARYGKTRFGLSAYEILYWIVDATNARDLRWGSQTSWLHAKDAETTATVLELAQGVENDASSLRLTISLGAAHGG